ncbi:hypothetical protein [Nesterenkonia sp. CF4.4]|uniref:hypothetical protein n=1 Tax=Nesterenkonia sp. CF4.4 TaxID=3373079 RepID=UPI003EE75126
MTKVFKDSQTELALVQKQISLHEFCSERVRRAQNLVEELKARSEDKSVIDAALKAEGLPSLQEQGLIVIKGGLSWARLHRRRKKLEDRIARRR